MERVLSTEERIRRAEEVYRNKNNIRQEHHVNSVSKSKNRLLKKMIIQIIVCLSVYSIFYFFGHSEDLFSKDMLNKAKEIMTYDINFDELYNNFMNWLHSMNILPNEGENEITNNITNETLNEIDLNEAEKYKYRWSSRRRGSNKSISNGDRCK